MLKYLLALALCLVPAGAAFAQFNSPGALGTPGFHSSLTSFVGPGDVTSFLVWWSNTRAFTAAKRGGAIINVCNSTGGVDVGCADMSTDPTTGILTSATVSGITCPGANCTVKTYYDQVGSNNCTQNTIANRLTLSTNQFGTLPAGQGGGGNTSTNVYDCTALAQSVPWSMYSVSNQPSGSGGTVNFDTTVQENAVSFPGLFTTQATPSLDFACGTTVNVGVTLPNSYVWIGVCNGASGKIIINGTSTTLNAGNTALTTSGYTLHNWRHNSGKYGEGGVLAADLTTNAVALTNNARAFYGF